VDIEQVDAADGEFLADLLSRYQSETGSPVAAALLQDWETALTRLRRVMPKDYKRVLAATRRARRDGRDVAEAVMAAARA
jgi:glutamate synthase (NADPH/NADH) large chain